jgi:hypothetical protein
MPKPFGFTLASTASALGCMIDVPRALQSLIARA